MKEKIIVAGRWMRIGGITSLVLTFLSGVTYLALMEFGIVPHAGPSPWMWAGLALTGWLAVPGMAILFLED